MGGGGSSGGGGGGGSGAVSYPAHMTVWHTAALGTYTGTPISDIMAAKIGASPFATLSAYDPETEINAMIAALSRYSTFIDTVSDVMWGDMLHSAVKNIDDEIFTEDVLTAEIDAYNATVEANLNNSVLPRFRRGMQDINAVNSSAFILGEAFLEAESLRDKAKFSADLHLQHNKERTAIIIPAMEQKIKILLMETEMERIYLQASLEKSRMAVVARKEETDQDIHLTELDGRWDLEVFSYGGNFLGSIGAASVRTGAQTNPTMSALGLGMSGLGAMLGVAALAGL
jgi:hypothetical protein